MNSKSYENHQRGFSLIEVMIAIVILTVALLSLAQLMAIATRQNALSGRVTSAASLAKVQLERLKATPFYSYDVKGAWIGMLAPGGDLKANLPNYSQFYRPDGQVAQSPSEALFVVRWEIMDLVIANATTRLPFAMKRITVRCLPTAEEGSMFQTIGDAVFVTYRTANIG